MANQPLPHFFAMQGNHVNNKKSRRCKGICGFRLSIS